MQSENLQSRPHVVRKVKEAAHYDMTENQFLEIMERSMMPLQHFFMFYKCAIMEIETKFKVLNEQFSLNGESNPIEFIQSRIKSYGSLYRKMESRGLPKTLESISENIHDIAGVRVVCSFVKDIYRLAECFLKQDDITLIERKDYIENPKPNGYRSLHLIVEVPIFLENEKKPVRAEVQLRTIAMDFWASLEHKLRYKKDLSDEQLKMLADELKSCADQSAVWDRKMQQIKNIIECT